MIFSPSVGKITQLRNYGDVGKFRGFRIDTGYKASDNIGVYYDPLIAKIIGYGEDREDAISETESGLSDIAVAPIITNSFTLFACLENED